ncbi:hypothetical protein [Marinagarivorans cellulosilyticus]|uniref:hypothetical protein n=1 Tax=Marinagarivorans cellulosilyticus TaxID=2721545 RepID=UPI001F34F290|nr:hypothetical protein [Marinagarivorans cellulosilyticus]
MLSKYPALKMTSAENRIFNRQLRACWVIRGKIVTETTDPLPFDEGAKAYKERKTPESNPYPEDHWKHKEWHLGWSDAEECDGESWDWTRQSFKAN